MTERRRGRPAKDAAPVTERSILARALAIVDADGPSALSLRRLAADLAVTPMALYHHVKSRDALVGRVIDHVLADVGTREPEGDVARMDDLVRILEAYGGAVARHPNAFVCLFASPGARSVEADRITRALTGTLRERELPPAQAELVRDILIDHAHGFAISLAMAGDASPGAGAASDRYRRAAALLIERLVPGGVSPAQRPHDRAKDHRLDRGSAE